MVFCGVFSGCYSNWYILPCMVQFVYIRLSIKILCLCMCIISLYYKYYFKVMHAVFIVRWHYLQHFTCHLVDQNTLASVLVSVGYYNKSTIDCVVKQ